MTRTRPSFRPRLEALEDRCVPSTLTVTNILDSGKGSLRYEIAQAQSNDTIVFNFVRHGNISYNYPQTITLTSGELDIVKNLTIQGPGAGQLTISGANLSRVFAVPSGITVSLSGLTISNGDGAASDYGSIPDPLLGDGGGVLNQGKLTVSGCTISNNVAYGFGGGGIYNAGTLTVSGCSIANNTAYNGGGIENYGGTATVTNTIVSGDHAEPIGSGGYVGIPPDFGGGIDNSGGTMTVSGCTLSGNFAGEGGGGISNGGTMMLSGCTISNNSVEYEGGGIDNGGAMTVSGCTLSGNYAGVNGGGIYNAGSASALRILDSIFGSNKPDNIYGSYTDDGGNTFK